MEQENNGFFKKSAWKAILFSIAALILGEAILGWQYNRLEQQRIPQLEEKIERQNQELQEQKAEDVLRLFLAVRIDGDEDRAMRYVTEQTAEQLAQGTFALVGDFKDYEIQSKKPIGENEFRFLVALFSQNGQLSQLELIQVKKILDEYYIDSVRLAG